MRPKHRKSGMVGLMVAAPAMIALWSWWRHDATAPGVRVYAVRHMARVSEVSFRPDGVVELILNQRGRIAWNGSPPSWWQKSRVHSQWENVVLTDARGITFKPTLQSGSWYKSGSDLPPGEYKFANIFHFRKAAELSGPCQLDATICFYEGRPAGSGLTEVGPSQPKLLLKKVIAIDFDISDGTDYFLKP